MYDYIIPAIDLNNRIIVSGTPAEYADTASRHVISVAYDIESLTMYDIESYYSSAVGKQGDALKQALAKIITANSVKLSYTPGIWDVVKEADENPHNSDELWLAYTEMTLSKEFQDGSSSNSVLFNREHTWAQSHGLNDDSGESSSAITDAHNLRAEERNVNSLRSNRDFVEGSDASGWGTVESEGFYPKLSSRGDVARIMMYMQVRWEDEKGITLDDNVSSASADRAGKLSDLLKWHSADPVDPYEIRRNNVVFKHQKNRNPFVDHPELVDYVFGELQDTAWDGGVVYSIN